MINFATDPRVLEVLEVTRSDVPPHAVQVLAMMSISILTSDTWNEAVDKLTSIGAPQVIGFLSTTPPLVRKTLFQYVDSIRADDVRYRFKLELETEILRIHTMIGATGVKFNDEKPFFGSPDAEGGYIMPIHTISYNDGETCDGRCNGCDGCSEEE